MFINTTYLLLKKIFLKSRYKIVFLWFLDLISSAKEAFLPLVIANAIDGIIENEYYWFIGLIVLEAIFLVLDKFNAIYSIKTYSMILAEENTNYYNKALLSKKIKMPVISARAKMIYDIADFFEFDIPEMVSMIIGIIVAFVYLVTQSTIKVTIFAFTEIMAIFALLLVYNKRIKENNRNRKDEEEKELTVLSNRNPQKYREYLNNFFGIRINEISINSCIQFLICLIHIMLLVFIFKTNDSMSAGAIYASITYIYNLNAEILEIPSYYENCINLIDIANRLE